MVQAIRKIEVCEKSKQGNAYTSFKTPKWLQSKWIRFVASVSSKKNIYWMVEILWQPLEASIQWFLKLTLATKRSEKGIENCAKKWCLFLSTILFEVTWTFRKKWWSILSPWHQSFQLTKLTSNEMHCNCNCTAIPLQIVHFTRFHLYFSSLFLLILISIESSQSCLWVQVWKDKIFFLCCCHNDYLSTYTELCFMPNVHF